MNSIKKSVITLTCLTLIATGQLVQSADMSLDVVKNVQVVKDASCSPFMVPGLSTFLDKIPTLSEIKSDSIQATKLAIWLANALSLGYYFLHRPVNRPSKAPFENVLLGNYNNVIKDIFNWDNITNFSDIIPGQRWKIYSTKINCREMRKVRLFVDPDRVDIRGFGLYHFIEKNMNKIVKLTAALTISYGLLHGKLQCMTEQMVNIILNAYTNANRVIGATK